MTRIEVNVQTSEVKTIPLTQQEIDDALARTAAEQAQPRVKSDLEALTERVAAVEEQLRTR